MNKFLRIAVISDLHIGKARSSNMNPTGSPGLGSELLQVFEEFVKSDLEAMDYLLVCGDITNGATEAEVNLASSIVDKIANLLGVSNDGVYWTLGNHDRSWDLISAHGSASVAYKFFEDSNFQNVIDVNGKGSLTSEPFYTLREDDKLLIATINTSAHDLPNTKPHHGKVTTELLGKLSADLDTIADKEDLVRILLMHHHPLDYPDLSSIESTDFSALQNAGNLISFLSEHKFDLVVHGHRHYPSFKYEATNTGHFVAFLCAGSFSALLDPEEGISNQFHIIELEPDRCSSGLVRGVFKSWAYLGRNKGWQKCNFSNSVIQHKLGFGMFATYAEFREKFESDVLGFLAEKGTAGWAQFLENCPDYEFFHPNIVMTALKELNSNNQIRLFNDDSLERLVVALESI